MTLEKNSSDSTALTLIWYEAIGNTNLKWRPFRSETEEPRGQKYANI